MPTLSSRFDDALLLASEHHRRQMRKETETPYLSHLMAVSALVLENSGTEDEAIAGLLHDAVEDAEDIATLTELRRRISDDFGDVVLDIIEACSDSDASEKAQEHTLSITERLEGWKARKSRYVDHMRTAPGEVLLVSASDKVHNARAIVRDLETVGRRVFQRFRAGEELTIDYYRRLAEVFTTRVVDEPRIDWLAKELHRRVAEMAKG